MKGLLIPIGVIIVLAAFVSIMIAPFTVLVPGLGLLTQWLAASAWWLLPVGLFTAVTGFTGFSGIGLLIAILVAMFGTLFLQMGGIL